MYWFNSAIGVDLGDDRDAGGTGSEGGIAKPAYGMHVRDGDALPGDTRRIHGTI
jgi:hypothetical protein